MNIEKKETYDYEYLLQEETDLPLILGNFENIEKTQEFLSENLINEHSNCYAQRIYSDKEIFDFECEILDIIKFELPKVNSTLREKELELEGLKQQIKSLQEVRSAQYTKIEDFRKEIEKGTTDIKLEQSNTFKIPLHNKKYYYVLTEKGDLKLAHISLMSEQEKTEIWNSTSKNEEYFEKIKNKGKTIELPKIVNE